MEWLPIEGMPDKGEFLVYMPDEHTKYQVMVAHPNVSFIGNAFAFDLTAPTHYMKLPEPPK